MDKAGEKFSGIEFDLLVIGGGATGAGIALDAASRGYKTALLEKNDFAEGTSGRSTKLIHGGIRYLEKAVKGLDRSQYELVREGLKERSVILRNAPHLTRPVNLLVPVDRFYRIPYVYAGVKFYDLLAGAEKLKPSRLLGRREALGIFPGLDGDVLKAAVLYADGQFSDARMALALIRTAEKHGAKAANHAAVTGFEKKNGKISAALVRDGLTGEEFTVSARIIINAAGPFADSIRLLDEPGAEPLLTVSSGAHIALDGSYVPEGTGLLVPDTEDGRLIFALPWEGGVIAGTTDNPARPEEHPAVTESEIQYLIRHLNRYFGKKIERKDVLSVWSGLRPLLSAPRGNGTADLVREHAVRMSASGLVTIAGGKWTSYRRMAKDAVDFACKAAGLPQRPCVTVNLVLNGSENHGELDQGAPERVYGLPPDIARRLVGAYGSEWEKVAGLAMPERLVPGKPFTEAEVIHAVREEHARLPMDVLARRTPLALLDIEAARLALPRAAGLMARELRWDEARATVEIAKAEELLKTGI